MNMISVLLWFIWLIAVILIFAVAIRKTHRQKTSQKKKRSAKKPQSRSSSSYASYKKKTEAPKEDILTRSRRNTEKKTASSSISQTISSAIPSETRDSNAGIADQEAGLLHTLSHSADSLDLTSSDLMSVVEDLIVKGYEPKLSFERDFIAEGADLLNSYYYKKKSRNYL